MRAGMATGLARFALGVAIVLATAARAPAQQDGVDADADEAAPRAPLTVELIEDLRFGKVVADPVRNGEVLVDAVSGRKLVRGGVYDFGGSHSRAEIRLSGEPDARYVVLVPDTVSLSGRGGQAVLTDIVVSPDRVGRLGPDGRAIVYVGATLTVRPALAGSSFGGTFQILADYE